MKPTQLLICTLGVSATIGSVCSARAQSSYAQHNLVSDVPGLADHTDPKGWRWAGPTGATTFMLPIFTMGKWMCNTFTFQALRQAHRSRSITAGMPVFQ